MTFGSLFAGIGGLDLGLERAGMTCKWQVENDSYAVKLLEKHWPDVTRYGDIREVEWEGVEPVDLICAGFPCQDVSVAGKRAGIEGERTGLWTEVVRCLRDLRPRLILLENVPGLLSLGFGRVLGDLAEGGYDAEWGMFSACALGAPHTRQRVFIVAYAGGDRIQGRFSPVGCGMGAWGDHTDYISTSTDPSAYRRGTVWASEPSVGRVVDGLPYLMDRLRCLGNTVVPQVAEWIGRRIVTAVGPPPR